MIDDHHRNIFLSSIFPTLLAEEKDQEWCGCTIEKSAKRLVVESLYGEAEYKSQSHEFSGTHPLVFYPSPRKNNNSNTYRWCLNWIPLCNQTDLEGNLFKLIEPKKENTSNFARWIKSLPSTIQELPKELYPAKYFETIKTRGGIIFLFRDADNNLVDLPDGASFHFQII